MSLVSQVVAGFTRVAQEVKLKAPLASPAFTGTPTVNGVGMAILAPGIIESFGGVITPSGYLACDGSDVSRTTYAALWQAMSFQFTATITSASPNLTAIAMTRGALADIKQGMSISGPGIPAGTTVLSVNTGTSTIVMSANASASSSGTVNVAPWGVGDGSTTFTLPDARARMLLGMASNIRLGANDGVIEAQRLANFAHGHTHTATSTETAVSAGTPAGTLSSVSAGTPAGSLSSDSAGTPAGSIGDHAAHWHGPGTYGTNNNGGFTTAIGVGVANHADHGHGIGTLVTQSVANHNHTIGVPSGTVTSWAIGNSGANSTPRLAEYTGHNHGGSTGNDGGHAHGMTGSIGGSTALLVHTVTVTQSSEPDHAHAVTTGVSANPNATMTHAFTGTALGTHSHTFTGTALATHGHTFTGTALGTHSHTITTTVNSGGSTDHPYLGVAVIIKT